MITGCEGCPFRTCIAMNSFPEKTGDIDGYMLRGDSIYPTRRIIQCGITRDYPGDNVDPSTCGTLAIHNASKSIDEAK
jgi:hypothetical protein